MLKSSNDVCTKERTVMLTVFYLG